MKKLTILLLSILISFNSYGKWQEIAKDTEDVVYYINPDSITRFKDSVTVKVLQDFPKPQVYGFRSLVLSARGDCKAHTFREEKVSYHQQKMGRGASLYEGSVQAGSTEVPKGSIGRIILDYVCNFDKKGKNQDLSSYSSSNNAVKVDTKKQKSVSINYKKDLEAIKDLFESGLITKEDYDKQKQKILDRM